MISLEKTNQRLNELLMMKDGWYNGEGVAPSSLIIDKARIVLVHLLVQNFDLPHPGIFPTYEGGVQMEFDPDLKKNPDFNSRVFTLEFMPSNNESFIFHMVDLANQGDDGSVEEHVNYNEIQKLFDLIKLYDFELS